MKINTRKVTRQLLAAIDDGMISKDAVIAACLDYMSEAEVADMCEIEGLIEVDEGVLFDEC
jgi:hypothetical protein